ncbi:aa3-type cytochrome c oxidase subunit IV [Epibacterium ulvae]|nr:aa3-type cytochrome c oxidase subunit IV [Epibacterium ulvae]MBT8155285.1 aa3-type cytochrome c oxidase subunit IV [Epibacterium ulvae]
MAEHKHGTMNSDVQEQTYTGFISFVTRFCVATVIFLVFLAIFAI